MAANVYECLFLLDTTKVAGDVPAAAKQIQTILERHNAEILASRPWDERRLAYPVNGQKKGLYYLTYFRMEPKNLPEIQVMMLTVYEDSEKIFKALKAGASGYLLKRTTPAELLEAITDMQHGGAPMTCRCGSASA